MHKCFKVEGDYIKGILPWYILISIFFNKVFVIPVSLLFRHTTYDYSHAFSSAFGEQIGLNTMSFLTLIKFFDHMLLTSSYYMLLEFQYFCRCVVTD